VSFSVPPARLRDVLEPWCAAEVSGALRVLDAPGGSVYLVDGRLEYAESPVVSGVDRLLTASGRLPADAWRAALTAGRQRGEVAEELVGGGLITRVELETVALLALYDAAHFLFDTVAEVRFEPGVRHPLGLDCRLDLAAACREVDRRKRLLIDAWPDASIDTAAVIPARRLPNQYVALTALQWEVVANADRRRSPIDLARLLGRDTYTVMLEVRRMARAGLVEPGRPGGSAAAESVATVRARAAEPPPRRPRVRVEEPAPPELASTNGATLPHRAANGSVFADLAPLGFDDQCSEEILLRIRDGLAALR
jgi:hypothetical protein